MSPVGPPPAPPRQLPGASPRSVGAPRTTIGDHLRVAWLLVTTLSAALPFFLFILFSPVLRPWMRARLRRRLARPPLTPEVPPAPDPAAWAGKTVFVVAGEASGDRLAARVVEALRARCPALRVRGYAGPACAAAGVALDKDLTRHAMVGFFAVAWTLGTWWRICAETIARFRTDPPDLLLTVDFPGLNAQLAGWAKTFGIRTVHLVAPAVWAWGPWRIFRWRRGLDRLLTTFPFEPVLFADAGIPSSFVGHPLFEAPLPSPRTPERWPGGGPCVVELLPGSRKKELEHQVPIVLGAAARIERALPQVSFVARLAEPGHAALFERAAARASQRPSRLTVEIGSRGAGGTEGPGGPLLGAVASSGTVTAELGAALVPMAVFYRVAPLARFGAVTLLTAPWFCLVNLIAGAPLVPERIVTRERRGPQIGEDFLAVAGTAAAWEAMRARLVDVRARLELPHVADRAACAALSTVAR